MQWYLKVIKEHYADFNGRARRKEYWMFYLINIIIAMVFSSLAAVTQMSLLTVITGLYSLAILIPGLALTVRRLHDIGKSWIWILISLVQIGRAHV